MVLMVTRIYACFLCWSITTSFRLTMFEVHLTEWHHLIMAVCGKLLHIHTYTEENKGENWMMQRKGEHFCKKRTREFTKSKSFELQEKERRSFRRKERLSHAGRDTSLTLWLSANFLASHMLPKTKTLHCILLFLQTWREGEIGGRSCFKRTVSCWTSKWVAASAFLQAVAAQVR